MEELNLEPCTAQPPGLQEQMEKEERRPEGGGRKEPEELCGCWEILLEYLLNSHETDWQGLIEAGEGGKYCRLYVTGAGENSTAEFTYALHNNTWV